MISAVIQKDGTITLENLGTEHMWRTKGRLVRQDGRLGVCFTIGVDFVVAETDTGMRLPLSDEDIALRIMEGAR